MLIEKILLFLRQIFWGWPTLLLILSFGLYVSVRLRFFQIFRFRFWIKEALSGLLQKENGGSLPLASLSTALAGSAGTGNIAGVAVAVFTAGPGVIFWMWLSSFLCMAVVFGENAAASLYRDQGAGGPMYVLRDGLGSKAGAVIFSCGCILSSFAMGNAVQSGAVSGVLVPWGISPEISGAVTAVLVFFIICGGFHRISSLFQHLIPVLTGLYFLFCLGILICRCSQLPAALLLVFRQAFSLKGALAGSGCTLLLSARAGISRGIFTNEAGLGSTVMALAASRETPVRQGARGMLQVFLDTTLMCTLTGLCLIVTDAYRLPDSLSMCAAAFSSVYGSFGAVFVTAASVLFAFAAIPSWYFYGEQSLLFLWKDAPLSSFRLLFATCTFFACRAAFSSLWIVGDLFNGWMALPNLTALWLLSGRILHTAEQSLENSRKSMAFFSEK